MTARRAVAASLLVGLVLAGCGSSSPTAEPASEEVPAASTSTPTDANQSGESPPTTTLGEQADVPAETEVEPPVGEPTTVTTTTIPPEPEAEPAIVDECSTDGSPTALEVADGPPPELAVAQAAAASDSPLPALAVRRINCGGGWMQLRNEIPADRALLVWFWAPH